MSGSCLYCQSPTENKSGACLDCRALRWHERTPTDWPTYLRCDECGAEPGHCCRDDDDQPMLRPCGGRAFRAVTRCWACGTVVPVRGARLPRGDEVLGLWDRRPTDCPWPIGERRRGLLWRYRVRVPMPHRASPAPDGPGAKERATAAQAASAPDAEVLLV